MEAPLMIDDQDTALQKCMADTVGSLTMNQPSANPNGADPFTPPPVLQSLPRFRPKPQRISQEELRASRLNTGQPVPATTSAPSSDPQLAVLDAKILRLETLLERVSQRTDQPPQHQPVPTPDPTPVAPLSELLKRPRGRPPGTGKNQIAAQLLKEASQTSLKQETPLVSATPSPPSVAAAPTRQETALPIPQTSPPAIERLIKDVTNLVNSKDSWKVFRASVVRLGAWKPDRLPNDMYRCVYAGLLRRITDPVFLRRAVLSVLCISPTSSPEAAFFWIVTAAGWGGWLDYVNHGVQNAN